MLVEQLMRLYSYRSRAASRRVDDDDDERLKQNNYILLLDLEAGAQLKQTNDDSLIGDGKQASTELQ